MRRSCLLLSLALTLGALLLLPSSAIAAPYDGSDPGATGCASSAYTISSFYDRYYGGYVELRYSTSCSTAWARFSCAPGPIGCGDNNVTIVRLGYSPDGYARYDVPFGAAGQTVWTPQVYDGGNNQSIACIWYGTSIQQCTAPF